MEWVIYMPPDKKKSLWGTIFLDASRESTLGDLDAMQATAFKGQHGQRSEGDYLEKVRMKATERARTILGEAYTERQRVLEEARHEAMRIRAEAEATYTTSERIRTEARNTRNAMQAELDKLPSIQNKAREEGFQAGLEQAQDELAQFRSAMGTSMAGVLKAIEGQCPNIFEGWREELVLLLKACVAKGTGLQLEKNYAHVLEKLFLEAVRQLDDRRTITVRVHPDDESAVADMFAAAKEKLPDLERWSVVPDASLELGGLIVGSHSGSVDSRLELFRDMVENILEHLSLPESALETEAFANVEKVVEQESENIEALGTASSLETERPSAVVSTETSLDEAVAKMTETMAMPIDAVPSVSEPVTSFVEDMPATEAWAMPDDMPIASDAVAGQEEDYATVLPVQQEMLAETEENMPFVDTASEVDFDANFATAEVAANADFEAAPEETTFVSPFQGVVGDEPTRQELEEELLPLSLDAPSYSQEHIFAEGGFLDPDAMASVPSDVPHQTHKDIP